MTEREKVIKAWEIFRDSNPYEICSGREFQAIREPEYCMGQMIEDTIALLKEQEDLGTELTYAVESIRRLQKDKDKLCLEVSEWKHKFHDRPLKEQEAVKQKTGHWIYKKHNDMFMCSCCEKYSIRNDYPYCHWCGAEMEKGGRLNDLG